MNKSCGIREIEKRILHEKSERVNGNDVKEVKDVEEVKDRRLRRRRGGTLRMTIDQLSVERHKP